MRHKLYLFALLLAGCATGGGNVITEAPSDWSRFENDTITLEGRAGNSKSGPILRLNDGRFIELENMPRPFSPEEVARSIGVQGKVVPGTGIRQTRYVIQIDRWWLLKTSTLPQKSAKDTR